MTASVAVLDYGSGNVHSAAKALLDQKIIAKAPEGAYTTEITDAASK